jgi:hypothetical protein
MRAGVWLGEGASSWKRVHHTSVLVHLIDKPVGVTSTTTTHWMTVFMVHFTVGCSKIKHYLRLDITSSCRQSASLGALPEQYSTLITGPMLGRGRFVRWLSCVLSLRSRAWLCGEL